MTGMVIIGAGECGTRAAFALRENGWDGAITLIGAESGLPYERPPLSKPGQDGVRRKLICDARALQDAAIDYKPGVTATALDPAQEVVTLSTGESLGYHRLLLATGARPRKLTCPGSSSTLDFRTDRDAQRIFSRCPAAGRVAIIGAGLIGMELAAVLSAKGVAVELVEAGSSALGRAVPPHLAARILQRHRDAGVTFRFDANIAAIAEDGIQLADGTRVTADLVVSAIGVVPDTALAEAAGLHVGNGITVDHHLQSSRLGIFAAGDCACVMGASGQHIRSESWRNARDQAETAARNMIGAREDFIARPWFWSDQFDLGLQVAGQPQPDHQMINRALPGGAELTFYLQHGTLVAAAGLGPGNSISKEIKLAEMLIAARAHPDAAALADPAVNLKSLLKTAQAA